MCSMASSSSCEVPSHEADRDSIAWRFNECDPTLFLPSDELPGDWVQPEGYTFKVEEAIIAETGTAQLESIIVVPDGILVASQAALILKLFDLASRGPGENQGTVETSA